MLLFVFVFVLYTLNGHNILVDNGLNMNTYESIHDISNDEHKRFEEINSELFKKRIIGTNYTTETINGRHIKYYITDTGDWHLGIIVCVYFFNVC